MVQCKAKSKRTGERCKAPAVRGREVCYYHGGRQARGIAHHEFKHGRYSKAMPTRLLEKLETNLRDPDLVVLRQEIALCQTRIQDLLTRVDTGEGGGLFKQAQTAYLRFRDANLARDHVGAREALLELEHMLTRGVEDYAIWGEIREYLDTLRKLTDSERKRLMDLQLMVTVDKFATFAQALLMSVKRHVTDQRQLLAIQRDIEYHLVREDRAGQHDNDHRLR